MAKPNSRDTLIDYAKRRLGEPVLEINVDEDQLEDRLDEAIEYFQEYHSDATVKTYFKNRQEVAKSRFENQFWFSLNVSVTF